MSDFTSRSKISCEIRCVDLDGVETVMKRLPPAGAEWMAYTCTISGKTEAILLIGDAMASRLTGSLPAAGDANGFSRLAGLYSAALYECDI
ncbi:hypothetical protein GCM10011352_14000 [Marinobacterium zhoushanense]|uniref:Uncharacterized protein n=1 Tax=Marinobacterium zhoushanense TaxID=1679163 RepID=A0ABQ1K6J0_9GAMM|nr:hypothetical protein GCM10011352_14000 [Marinobacterium zhoushanense]